MDESGIGIGGEESQRRCRNPLHKEVMEKTYL